MDAEACAGPCNSRARRLWREYEAAWNEVHAARTAAAERGDTTDLPEYPSEPDVRVFYGTPVFCRRCTSTIRTAFSDLDHLASLLQADIDGMRGNPDDQEKTGKRGKGASAPSPDPRVEELDEFYRAFAAAEDKWRSARGYAPRPYMGEAGEQPLHAGSHPRTRTLSWLDERCADIVTQPGFGAEFGLMTLSWRQRLERAAKAVPEPSQRNAHCPRCKKRTLWGRDDGNIECRNPDCRRVMDGDEYEEVLQADLKRGGKPAEAALPEAC